jgi:transcription elongation factor Elf1
MRRQRRRANASTRLYCGTNGCTSFLEIDEKTGTAHCRICGYVRRVH